MKHRAQILVIRGLFLVALFGYVLGQPATSNSLASRVAGVFAANCFSWSGEDLLVKFWNSGTLEEVGSLDQQSDWVSVLDISPDGLTLVLGRYDGTVSFVPIPPGPDRREYQIAR